MTGTPSTEFVWCVGKPMQLHTENFAGNACTSTTKGAANAEQTWQKSRNKRKEKKLAKGLKGDMQSEKPLESAYTAEKSQQSQEKSCA